MNFIHFVSLVPGCKLSDDDLTSPLALRSSDSGTEERRAGLVGSRIRDHLIDTFLYVIKSRNWRLELVDFIHHV